MELIDMLAIKHSPAWRKFAEWVIEESPSAKDINKYLRMEDVPQDVYDMIEHYRNGLVDLDLGIK